MCLRDKLAIRMGWVIFGGLLMIAARAASANYGIYVGGPAEIGRYSGPKRVYGPGYNFPYPAFRYQALRQYDNGVWPKNPDIYAYPTAGYQSYYYPNETYYQAPKGKHHCRGGCR